MRFLEWVGMYVERFLEMLCKYSINTLEWIGELLEYFWYNDRTESIIVVLGMIIIGIWLFGTM